MQELPFCRAVDELYNCTSSTMWAMSHQCQSSLQTVEAARECGMACVVVAGRNPLYELTAADLVVRQLEELSLVNLKQLFQQEDRVDPRVRLQLMLCCGLLACSLCIL